MIGRGGSYIVRQDRENRAARRTEQAAAIAAAVAAAGGGDGVGGGAAAGQLELARRPVMVAAPPTTAPPIVRRGGELLLAGNREFMDEHYVSAVDSYSQALRILSTGATGAEEEKEAVEELRVASLLNRAACAILNESYSSAVQDCTELLASVSWEDVRGRGGGTNRRVEALQQLLIGAEVRRALALEGQEQWAEAQDAYVQPQCRLHTHPA
jgi:hypothetical protein